MKNQRVRITLITIAAFAVFIGGTAGINHMINRTARTATRDPIAAENIAEAVKTGSLQDGLHIKLLSDQEPNAEFNPGAEIPVNARIENTGTENAYVFIQVTMPTVSGAELENNSNTTTDALLYTPSDSWEKVTDGVYFYKELLAPGETTPPLIDHWTIPKYNLSYSRGSDSDNGSETQILTGSIPIETAVQAASSVSLQVYSIMEMKNATPEQLWQMLGGES